MGDVTNNESPGRVEPDDAVEMARRVREREVSAVELVEQAIQRAEALDPLLNAVVADRYEAAVGEAAAIDSGTSPFADRPLAGVPFLVKDLFADVAGLPSTDGSRALRDYIATADTELIRRYRELGLVIIGKSNTPEFGATPVTEGKLFGPTRNPWNGSRTAGGSSGGSAAAVAADIVPAAHGNDGGGSLRIPASCCGVFGFKPSRGRMPLRAEDGDLHARIIVDHVITRSVRDSAVILDATQGTLSGAVYTTPSPLRDLAGQTTADPGRLKIKATREPLFGVEPHPACLAAVDFTIALCEELGHEVEVETPKLDESGLMEAWFSVWAVANTALVRRAAARAGRAPSAEDFEPTTWRYYEIGSEVTSAAHLEAMVALGRAAEDIAHFMADVDVWLMPTLAQPPLELGDFYGPADNKSRYLRFSPYARLANIAGIPAMSVPLHWDDEGLPVGSQFFAGFGQESLLFCLAGQLERARPWSHRRPTSLMENPGSKEKQ